MSHRDRKLVSWRAPSARGVANAARSPGRALGMALGCLAVLSATAWSPAAAAPACPVDPYALPLPADREASLGLARSCGGEHLDWKVEPPDPGAAARRNGVLRARIDSVASERLLPGLLGSVRLGWSGLGGEPAAGLRTERAVLAAGGLLRLSDDWSLRLDLGRDLTAENQRATVGGLWQPVGSTTLFAQWSEQPGAVEPQRLVGGRWWLLPKRLAIDVQAMHQPGGWASQRVGLLFSVAP